MRAQLPGQGIEIAPPALKGKVLITGHQEALTLVIYLVRNKYCKPSFTATESIIAVGNKIQIKQLKQALTTITTSTLIPVDHRT